LQKIDKTLEVAKKVSYALVNTF